MPYVHGDGDDDDQSCPRCGSYGDTMFSFRLSAETAPDGHLSLEVKHIDAMLE